MMRNGYNNGGLLRVSRCSVFVMNLLVLLEYTGCYLRYLIFVSNFSKCYNCTVLYRIFLRAYRNMCRSLCIGGIRVCRCIVSALNQTKPKPNKARCYFLFWEVGGLNGGGGGGGGAVVVCAHITLCII